MDTPASALSIALPPLAGPAPVPALPIPLLPVAAPTSAPLLEPEATPPFMVDPLPLAAPALPLLVGPGLGVEQPSPRPIAAEQATRALQESGRERVLLSLRTVTPFDAVRTRSVQRSTDGASCAYQALARVITARWVDVLAIVKPATVIGWHRSGYARFWAYKSSRAGRPPLGSEVVGLIGRMAPLVRGRRGVFVRELREGLSRNWRVDNRLSRGSVIDNWLS